MTSIKVQNQLLMAIEARARQAVTLLLGLRDPYSPLCLVDTSVVRLIMQFRCAPVYVTTTDGKQETRDPDSSQLQSFRGMPSLVYANGAQLWHRDGVLHRDGDMPAAVWTNGTKIWYIEGRKHRDRDLPAEVHSNGTMYWFRNGKRHRDGDMPADVWSDGVTFWYHDGIEYHP